MKVTVNKEPNCRRIIDIEVPSEEVNAEISRLASEYRSQATIPGFRKGKAPMDVVRKRYSDSIKADAFENLVKKAYEDAVTKEKINAIEQPKLSNIKFEENQPLAFRAEVEVLPDFKVTGYKGLKVTKKVREVTDNDVEETLKQIQRNHAEYFPVERSCHDQDLVVVDLIKKYDKAGRLEDEKLEDIEIDLGSDGVLKEFKEGLRGMSIGEMKDIEVKYPDDYSDKQLAGNEIKYTAMVKEVKEVKLPELNDEFAENYAQAESMDKLKDNLRETLKMQVEQEATNNVKSEIIQKVIEKNSFEVPESMVKRYLDSVTEDFKKRYKDVDDLKLRQSYRKIGEDTIRWQFIFRRIADVENVEVNEQDRAEWVKEFAGRYNMSEKTAREALGKAGKFQDIDENLLERKVLDYIMENSDISS
jgi:trigger factor